MEYGNTCGCAGGETVKVTSEALKMQRATSDVLGRTVKVEVLDGNSTYSTTTTSYDLLDHLTEVRQYQGTDAADHAFQLTKVEYDGHGRVKTSKRPEQSAATSFEHNDDDTTRNVTDARGATATYDYNNRRLVTGISYGTADGVAARVKLKSCV